jgi:magnesium transporter
MQTNINLWAITWIHYIKPTHKELEELGLLYDFHELVMEDLIQLNTQPKIDIYEDHIFLALHFPKYEQLTHRYLLNEFNIILGKNYIISVATHKTSYIDKIIKEYQEDVKYASEEYKISPYYVLYIMIDQMYEKGIKTLSNISNEIHTFWELLFKSKVPQKEILEKLVMKQININFIKNSFEPQEEILKDLIQAIQKLYRWELDVYFEDLDSKLTKITRHTKIQYENIDSLTSTYNTLLSMHHNSVVTILTIITSIFIPLTFVVWVYGMNFQSHDLRWNTLFRNMPELYHPYGYLIIVWIMLGIAIFQLIYFKKRKRI